MKLYVYSFLFTLLWIHSSMAYKILGIFPSMSKSHWIIGNALMEGLADAGHEVTVLSPFPLTKPRKNYRDLFVGGIQEKFDSSILYQWGDMTFYDVLQTISELSVFVSNYTIRHEKVHQFLHDPSEQFDVVILEVFLNEALLGIAHHFKAPVVGLCTLSTSISPNRMVGNPAPLSYVPASYYLSLTKKMTFYERLTNIYSSILQDLFFEFIYMPRQNHIFKENFPESEVTLSDLHKNVSLVLLNTHFTLDQPRPYVTNMIEVGGLQITGKASNLPEYLQKFLDNAEEGVIYCSLGSNIHSTSLDQSKKIIFEKILLNTKYKVLWKWDDSNIANSSKNVIIQKWFPQADILAHPNVKAFITHCGFQSISEAVYNGVPLIGIPIFAEQKSNIMKVEQKGFGLMVDFMDLNEVALSGAIKEIMENEFYSKNVKKLSKLFRDQPISPLSNAIYWVEYVARHNGAYHMQNEGQHLSFIQFYNLDVLTVIVLIFCIILYSLTLIIYGCVGKCFKNPTKLKVKRN